jgi:hypothetical protein
MAETLSQSREIGDGDHTAAALDGLGFPRMRNHSAIEIVIIRGGPPT